MLHWSRTQQLIALSSAEAELNASIKAGCEGLGIRQMTRELGNEHTIHLFGDSSANHGIAHRQGSGRIKHLEIRQLWLQEKVHLKELDFTKIPRLENIADMMTHYFTAAEANIHFGKLYSQRCSLEDRRPSG